MSKIQYAQCPFCGNHAPFDPQSAGKSGDVLVWCRSCRQYFPFKLNSVPIVPEGYTLVNGPEAPEAVFTAPVDQNITIDEFLESIGAPTDGSMETSETETEALKESENTEGESQEQGETTAEAPVLEK